MFSTNIHVPYFIFGGFSGFVLGYIFSKCTGQSFEKSHGYLRGPGDGVVTTTIFTFLGALLGFGYGLGKIASGTY
ncbi:hypothetical protein QLL95_gp0831 [Cotonvirus japonicus]|uniref:Transmembrane protein n=1 Tax=Cotonvirus japonicus TaxID=2811091 RepID=A0ABM7NT06_9VIRU|nr:hypothetical protein QLL95_gp0831 [Cotonvirus japonicus]BCS83292.1 hypothetical protein [Cotonvirus japonicus]